MATSCDNGATSQGRRRSYSQRGVSDICATSPSSGSVNGADNGYVQVFVRPLNSRPCHFIASCLCGGLMPWLLSSTGSSPPALVIGTRLVLACLLGYLGLSCGIEQLGQQVSACILPFFAILCAYYWVVLVYRKYLNANNIYVLFCATLAGEMLAYFLANSDIPGSGTSLASLASCLAVVGAATTLSSFPNHAALLTMLISAVLRIMAQSTLTAFPPWLRPPVGLFCGFGGVLAAKYTEASLRSPLSNIITQDGKILAVRRRRTSSLAGLHGLSGKTRRTSLPTLGGQRSHHGNQGSSSTVDVALLAEAHGLVTDMLADPSLPPHVISGLRALASLLTPPSQTPSHPRPRPGGASVALADFNSGSDTEEIPYTGERPSALPKRLRKNLPPGLLRRMSTSTWTTTTSATGMPTLEPEPSRKRSTSFRHSTDYSSLQPLSPGGGNSTTKSSSATTASPTHVPGVSSFSTAGKGRSYSTTSIPAYAMASLHRRTIRERKTVCSLHPLSTTDIASLHAAHYSAKQADQEDTVETEGDQPGPDKESCAPAAALLPSIRRVNVTSDYESSNESPSGSENNDAADRPTNKTGRCTLCGGRMRGAKEESRSPGVSDAKRGPAQVEPETTEEEPEQESVDEDIPGLLVAGIRYDLEHLSLDPLLNRISEWDYPIFELAESSEPCILSHMCYRVFLEVGLLDAFKIPLPEFLAYFHTLESGYRDKPYHNRMHAADVLHAVYYLTSQPIPGFSQMSIDSTDSPLHKSAVSDSSTSGTPLHRHSSFVAEDTYGIMGANFPALELMALYTAAAMHDYDHPGRTNAFLVSTYAPQAVLYNDRSVLENHHAAAAWSLFLSRPEFNWLCQLDKAEFKRFRFLVIECILATDLKRHFEILAEFNAKVNDDDAPGIDWSSETDRLLAMEMCIKLADINGPCKQHDIHVQWTHRIAEEFYEQGDEEASLGLPISPFMDRRNPQLAKLQESFITHLVAPLCNAYGEAGLLPGRWVDASESEDEGQSEAEKVETSDAKDTEDEATEKDICTVSRRRRSQQLKLRKVFCLQTKHLQENYEHWVNILKEENEAKNRTAASAGATSSSHLSQQEDEASATSERSISPMREEMQEEMETIQEVEEAQSLKGSLDDETC